jgi:hypothetical protein
LDAGDGLFPEGGSEPLLGMSWDSRRHGWDVVVVMSDACFAAEELWFFEWDESLPAVDAVLDANDVVADLKGFSAVRTGAINEFHYYSRVVLSPYDLN